MLRSFLSQELLFAGFVVTTPSAAQNAINITNGCQLGGKKLKVQLKRDNKQNKPYCLGGESWKEVENICNMWSTRNLDN